MFRRASSPCLPASGNKLSCETVAPEPAREVYSGEYLPSFPVVEGVCWLLLRPRTDERSLDASGVGSLVYTAHAGDSMAGMNLWVLTTATTTGMNLAMTMSSTQSPCHSLSSSGEINAGKWMVVSCVTTVKALLIASAFYRHAFRLQQTDLYVNALPR
jgi:hypothetical protein